MLAEPLDAAPVTVKYVPSVRPSARSSASSVPVIAPHLSAPEGADANRGRHLPPLLPASFHMYGPTETTIWSSLARVESGTEPEIVAASRTEPGCLVYIAHRHLEEPRRFMFYEQYVDEAAFSAHQATEVVWTGSYQLTYLFDCKPPRAIAHDALERLYPFPLGVGWGSGLCRPRRSMAEA